MACDDVCLMSEEEERTGGRIKLVHVRQAKCMKVKEQQLPHHMDISKTTHDSDMNCGVAVCY